MIYLYYTEHSSDWCVSMVEMLEAVMIYQTPQPDVEAHSWVTSEQHNRTTVAQVGCSLGGLGGGGV